MLQKERNTQKFFHQDIYALAEGLYVSLYFFFFSSRRRHTRLTCDWSSDVCSSDLERKRTMFDRADAFVALPGGIGTLEELVEQLTWAQLGRHRKPILIANINGYWDPLLTLVGHMRERAFVPDSLAVNFLVSERVEDILPSLRHAARGRAEAEKAMAIPAERL